MTDDDRTDWLTADAEDRRTALTAATELATSGPHRVPWPRGEDFTDGWLDLADHAYRWLRDRASLRVTAVKIIPGTPYPEGTPPMATVFDLSDIQSVTLSLTALDAKNVPVPLPAGFTAAWSLADPDASGAVLTPSADNTTAVLSAGVPDVNLLVSVAVTLPDGSVLNGAEAFIVQASVAATVGIVPGTPTP